MCWQNWDPARPAKKVLERHKMEKDTKDFTKFKFSVETKIWATVRMMMMIMHSTLILGKTCLTESAPLLRWLGIDQTFHCYSLFSNHSAVTQDTLLLLCFLHVFPFLFCVLLPRIFLCFLFICASFWIFSGLDRFFTPDIVLLLVGRSGYFKLFSVQRTTAEKIWKSGSRICSASAFFDPWNKKPNNYR